MFLLTDFNIDVVLDMLFLILSNVNIHFVRKKLTKGFYITTKALLFTKQLEIIDKKEFIKTALDKNVEVFVMHMTSFSLNLILINSAQKTQMALLVSKKVQIPGKYSDFLNIFLEKKALILLETTNLN